MTAPEPDAIAAWDKARKAYFWEGGKVTDLVRAADALRAALAATTVPNSGALPAPINYTQGTASLGGPRSKAEQAEADERARLAVMMDHCAEALRALGPQYEADGCAAIARVLCGGAAR